MSITSLFERLGAPLTNSRWSWGAQRAGDSAVFLRVWQDLKFIDDEGRRHMLVATPTNDDTKNLGSQERVRHVESIRSGAPCFMVMCVARDAEATSRTIKEFDELDIFVGGDIVETPGDFRFPPKTGERVGLLARNGATWIQVAGRKPVRSITPAGR